MVAICPVSSRVFMQSIRASIGMLTHCGRVCFCIFTCSIYSAVRSYLLLKFATCRPLSYRSTGGFLRWHCRNATNHHLLRKRRATRLLTGEDLALRRRSPRVAHQNIRPVGCGVRVPAGARQAGDGRRESLL